MNPSCVQRLREALDPARMRLTEEDEKRLTMQEQQLAQAVYAAIESSGVNLDYRKPLHDVHHSCNIQTSARHTMHLPFDVEVHQLASGQRMVLDTHRLLIPDVVWMDWMMSDEAKPRVWAVDLTNAPSKPSSQPSVHHGQLDCFCMSVDGRFPSPESLQTALHRWSGSTASFPSCTFKIDYMHRHIDTGCISASAEDSSGQVVIVAIVACPRWYYSGNTAMTCLLPPEAAHRLRELEGEDAFEGLSPDLIMAGDAGARSRARESIGKLYAKARAEVVNRYRDELAVEVCLTEDVDVQANPVVHRRVLKRLMHSLGLGLRHARLLVEQLEHQTEARHVCAALKDGQPPAQVSHLDAPE